MSSSRGDGDDAVDYEECTDADDDCNDAGGSDGDDDDDDGYGGCDVRVGGLIALERVSSLEVSIANILSF